MFIRLPVLLLVLITLTLTTACSSYPAFDYHPDNEIPQGPGLISGDDGVFEFQVNAPPGLRTPHVVNEEAP